MNKKINRMSVRDLSKGQVIVYRNKVEVRLDKETVWLNLNQMTDLFGRDKSVISRHLRNVFKEKELNKSSVVVNFATTAADKKIYQVEYFNLDAIISVGYRVNSKRGTQFRIWATNVLKQHLVNGYTINEKRLKSAQHKYQELQKSLRLLGNVIQVEAVSGETKGLIQVITEYSHALDILDDFDHERLSVPKGTKQLRFKLTYEEARKIIEAMKRKFKDSVFVGQEKTKVSKVQSGRFIKHLAAQIFIPPLRIKPLIYYILLLRTTVLWMEINVLQQRFLFASCKAMGF